MNELKQLFENFSEDHKNGTMKNTILQLLDQEIEMGMFISHRGHPNMNELQTPSLLIEFRWDTFAGLISKRMIDIQVSLLEGDRTETILHADDLSDEQVVKILLQAEYEEYASDMDVEELV